jgi:hypothetical protein
MKVEVLINMTITIMPMEVKHDLRMMSQVLGQINQYSQKTEEIPWHCPRGLGMKEEVHLITQSTILKTIEEDRLARVVVDSRMIDVG